MELIESDIEILNSRLRLLNWLYEEIKIYRPEFKNIINQKGQDLPINL
ncbi:MAG: hypothetical protein KGD63_05050 [Candidatus Lokiarchaeota archaeon]|nr:hypothetical protein [Candidatus Lokiarchaeota archaeon]